jgi:putative transposase
LIASLRILARIANIRTDAAHKLTTDLTRGFETILIEDLNGSGMAKNHSLAGAVLDSDSTKSAGSLSTRPRCVAGASWLPIGFTRRLRSVRVAAHPQAPKAVRNWMSNGGFAANAAHSKSVMRMPPSI